ncbi:MarR family winged helix-turn-helix transcriptional regulator [Actinocatenispora comari]|uniref:MarR family transcriptional regulator n=1 Tax=Actinocatenispora comari TaxID=2807577 RepID=A0A8J4EPB2_9ACTN|nr:MarR family transcriptional regulator [Actinocatenispora comari]GIL28569.1 MarR family transcriptional regulator [Actinocatenispora comari]
MLSPGFWLYHAALTWRAELDARLRPLGLTPTQFMVLATAGWLEHLNGPPTQQQVADGAGTDRQMTSRVVRALQDRGLITRHAHESNARSLRLTLTREGRALTRRAVEMAQSLDEKLFGPEPTSLRDALRGIAEFRDQTQR